MSTWNRVFMPYCSSDLWSGTRTEASSNSFDMIFAGHIIFQEIVAHLKEQESLGGATDVILTGASAGGIGVWINAGYLKEQLGSSARLALAPVAGFYNFAWPFRGASGKTYADFSEKNWPNLVDLWQSHYDQACGAALGNRSYACMLSAHSRPYIDVPAFIIEAQTDKVQLEGHDNLPKPPWNDVQTAYVETWSHNMTDAVFAVLKHADGYFMPSCYIHTSFSKHGPLIADESGQEVTYAQALTAWYSGSEELLADSCGIVCGHCSTANEGTYEHVLI